MPKSAATQRRSCRLRGSDGRKTNAFLDDRRATGSQCGVARRARRVSCWLGGFRSDMAGTKADMLDQWAAGDRPRLSRATTIPATASRAASSATGTISKWLAESLAVFRAFRRRRKCWSARRWARWIALRMVQELRKAEEATASPAWCWWRRRPTSPPSCSSPQLTEAAGRRWRRRAISRSRRNIPPEPTIYTRALIEDGACEPSAHRADRHALPGPHHARFSATPTCRTAMR